MDLGEGPCWWEGGCEGSCVGDCEEAIGKTADEEEDVLGWCGGCGWSVLEGCEAGCLCLLVLDFG